MRSLLADRQQALLYGISLGLGERATLGEAVDGVQGGVDEGGVVLGAGKEGGAAGQEGEQGRADVAVHGEGGLCGTQALLWKQGTLVTLLHLTHKGQLKMGDVSKLFIDIAA